MRPVAGVVVTGREGWLDAFPLAGTSGQLMGCLFVVHVIQLGVALDVQEAEAHRDSEAQHDDAEEAEKDGYQFGLLIERDNGAPC